MLGISRGSRRVQHARWSLPRRVAWLSRAPGADDSPADDLLLARIGRRDTGAFALFYDRHASAAYGLAWRMLGEAEAASAVVEQAFLRLWHDPRGHGQALPTAHASLVSLVHECAITTIRQRTFPTDAAHAPGDDNDQAEPTTSAHDQRLSAIGQCVDTALRQMPAVRRQALTLAYFEGDRCQEIAGRLGIPGDQVYLELARGLEDIRQTIAAVEQPLLSS